MHFPTNYRRRHIGFGGLCIQQHLVKLSSGSNASKRRRRKPHLDCGNSSRTTFDDTRAGGNKVSCSHQGQLVGTVYGFQRQRVAG